MISIKKAPRSVACEKPELPLPEQAKLCPPGPERGRRKLGRRKTPRPMGRTISVILIEDHILVRQSLRSVFEALGDISVAGEATSAEEGIELLSRVTACDVVVLDLNLPGESGLWCLDKILERNPALPVLILSMHAQRSVVMDMLRTGARGFVAKSSDVNELVLGVRALAAGGCYFDSRSASSVLDFVRGQDRDESGLTPREEHIVRMVCQGMSNQLIAERLCLSVSSIKNHLRTLFERFGVSDRTALVTAYEAQSRFQQQPPP